MNELINVVFSTLFENGVIKSPDMRYLINDRGISDEYFALLKKTFEQAQKLDDKESRYIIAYMCFGAGAYFASNQWILGKTIDTFTDADIDMLFKTLSEDDAIGLGYDALGILSGSYNYNKITKAIQMAYLSAIELNPLDDALMQAFFNVGVTLAYERFER